MVKIKRFIICEGLRKVPGTQSLRKIFVKIFKNFRDFSGGPVDKNLPANAGDVGSVPGLGRYPGVGHGSPLQYSCLENPCGPRSLVGSSPWGRKESDTTE